MALHQYHSKNTFVGRRGFEPLKSKDSGFTVRPIWPLWNLPELSHLSDSNQRPADYKSAALPTELKWPIHFYSKKQPQSCSEILR
jgi:hypothetical protein